MDKDIKNDLLPTGYEEKIYKDWINNHYFHADKHSLKHPYSLVIPPPNVTGSLHMGHALDITLQDILVRFHRLKKYEVLWMPGTDHAGIATQNVVEKMLAKDNISRHELGREKFIEKVWEWKASSGGEITSQLKRLGASCDWDKERFTMDEGLSKAVKKVFVTLYAQDLIYRSNYIVNWCPRCHTALSDLEVEHEEEMGALYYLKYPVVKSEEVITIATTRPETMLGDTAIAVNPEDDRYKHLIGQKAILPLMNREIPIIGDDYVDKQFGTGALKITPAHDPNDFTIGIKHNLGQIDIFDNSAVINDNGGHFKGLARFEARKEILLALKEKHILEKEEEYLHSVGHCYRCKTVIEPKISLQWFVKIKPLAYDAMNAVKEEKIKIIPNSWEKTYFEWMNNIRDWCISRQIWWGHRIPAWYCSECGHITVTEGTPGSCENCDSIHIKQDDDVLDTWFSSALWPFSTMGWPEKNETLNKFYPTSCLVTGFDILFFWVARMIMMGLKFMGEAPFKEVYLHALIRDERGQKMSKSKGNVIDPLVLIDKYGADAFRFSLASFASQGRDIKISEDRIEGYRNFTNKIWNAYRFLSAHLENIEYTIDPSTLCDEDKWILTLLGDTAEHVEKEIKNYRFDEASEGIYQFFWHTFCDWYIEFIKQRIFKDRSRYEALSTAYYVLKMSLIILHPFMPFITELIYKKLTGDKTITYAAYPADGFRFKDSVKKINVLIDFISLVRNIRGEYKVQPGVVIEAAIKTHDEDVKNNIIAKEGVIKELCRLTHLTFTDSPVAKAATSISENFQIFVPLKNLINIDVEIKRIRKEQDVLEKDYLLYDRKLKNQGFLKNAPGEVIAKDRVKLEKLKDKLEKIDETLQKLEESV